MAPLQAPVSAFRSARALVCRQRTRRRICRRADVEPDDRIRRAMERLIEEAERSVRERASPMVRDAAIVAEAQRIEHYGIAGYGVARAFADQLGEFETADDLQEILTEASMAGQTLSRLAEGRVDLDVLAAGRSTLRRDDRPAAGSDRHPAGPRAPAGLDVDPGAVR